MRCYQFRFIKSSRVASTATMAAVINSKKNSTAKAKGVSETIFIRLKIFRIVELHF
jgi:hypothetical protein